MANRVGGADGSEAREKNNYIIIISTIIRADIERKSERKNILPIAAAGTPLSASFYQCAAGLILTPVYLITGERD